MEAAEENFQAIQKKQKSIFNPLNWFDDEFDRAEQMLYSLELDGFKLEISGIQQCLNISTQSKKIILKLFSSSDSSINKIKSDIDRYNKCDRQEVSDELNRLNGKLDSLREDLKTASKLKNNFEVSVQPLMEIRKKYESDISNAKYKISKAQSFNDQLTDANSSYDRAMIHKECEEIMGEGRPKTIILEQEAFIRKNERDINKINKRIEHKKQTVIKVSRVRKIIIDGNNMCYESGDQFVGVDALLKAATELQKQYEIIIVFDSIIRSKIRTNDQALKSKFNSDIDIHVVATKQRADETILDIALNDDLCYILSNDRFGEYKDKEVIENDRLIRHEIVSGKVLINDLNINLEYG